MFQTLSFWIIATIQCLWNDGFLWLCAAYFSWSVNVFAAWVFSLQGHKVSFAYALDKMSSTDTCLLRIYERGAGIGCRKWKGCGGFRGDLPTKPEEHLWAASDLWWNLANKHNQYLQQIV